MIKDGLASWLLEYPINPGATVYFHEGNSSTEYNFRTVNNKGKRSLLVMPEPVLNGVDLGYIRYNDKDICIEQLLTGHNKGLYKSFMQEMVDGVEKIILPTHKSLDELLQMKKFEDFLSVCNSNNTEVILEYYCSLSSYVNPEVVDNRIKEVASMSCDSDYLIIGDKSLGNVSIGLRFDVYTSERFNKDLFQQVVEFKRNHSTLSTLRLSEEVLERDGHEDNVWFDEVLCGDYALENIVIDGYPRITCNQDIRDVEVNCDKETLRAYKVI